jgi:hypothetical protein
VFGLYVFSSGTLFGCVMFGDMRFEGSHPVIGREGHHPVILEVRVHAPRVTIVQKRTRCSMKANPADVGSEASLKGASVCWIAARILIEI